MTFQSLTADHPLWAQTREYARTCSWRAGSLLADAMAQNAFSGWERVIVGLEEGEIRAFCTVARKDCIPSLPYSPYIGFLFVDERARGRRVSEALIHFAMEYLRSIGFHEVYLVSDHEGLYEKYGFAVIDREMAPWGNMEKIYCRPL